MPAFTRSEKCDGCKGRDKTACMSLRAGDLMAQDRDGPAAGLSYFLNGQQFFARRRLRAVPPPANWSALRR